ncbi:MAG: rod shape-determining protein [Clostridia bacterium]|nr:rod shape-determining protein [Clostridia bacterium]
MATNIAIDIGTSKTVLSSGSKIVLELPSVVTVDTDTREPIYFGEKAFETIGRTPDSLTCVFPIQRSVIADYDVAESMLKEYMTAAFGSRIIKPKVMVVMPSGVTAMQHHSVADVVEAAGGRNAETIEAPLAIAVGLGIDLDQPKGSMIIDMGAGTTDAATLSMGGIAACDSIPVASRDFDEEIVKYVRRKYNILIGLATAEQIKMKVGTAMPHTLEVAIAVKGRHLQTGLPTTFEITSSEVYDAINEKCYSIISGIRKVIEKTPPDLVADIMTEGIYLTGGGALLSGFNKLLENCIGTKVHMPPDPLHTAVNGAAAALNMPEVLKNVDYQYRAIQELKIEG